VSYLAISAAQGATVAEHGIPLAQGARMIMDADHWRRAVLNSEPIESAVAAGRVVASPITSEELAPEERTRADEAWRRASSGAGFCSATIRGGDQ